MTRMRHNRICATRVYTLVTGHYNAIKSTVPCAGSAVTTSCSSSIGTVTVKAGDLGGPKIAPKDHVLDLIA
jgi:hypothetical protein